jgi:site-specific DNA recombinase
VLSTATRPAASNTSSVTMRGQSIGIQEYERALILERTRRGKTHRAKAGTVNVLSGAPFGYRYVRKTDHAEACYEIVPHEAAIVAELFARYADGGVAIGALARWLSGLGVTSRTGKTRWDRSVIWAMLRNPAYAGRACFGRTVRTEQTAGLNRTARRVGRATPRHYTVTERPREDWIEIGVPALVAEDIWHRVQQRLADNKRYALRNSINPSLLQGICVCDSCEYAYYRTSTRTTNKIIYYTAVSAPMTTATSTAGSAPTNPCAPTTSTPSFGTTSLPCSPTPN